MVFINLLQAHSSHGRKRNHAKHAELKKDKWRLCTAQSLLHFSRVCHNSPFPRSTQSLFQSKSECEIFVIVISSNFNVNGN